jgi:superfamily II DNA helicase RecQ
MTEMSVNCLFNKGKTGCGGTELAINQKGHTIIAVPFVNLARNKEITNERRQYEVLAVHGDISNDAILDYANTHETLKILVVYDSLPRLINILSDLGYNVYRDFFLLVDEYHILFNHYSFRHKPIKRLLELAQNFQRVTYMSATPIERTFILEELKDLPTVIVN